MSASQKALTNPNVSKSLQNSAQAIKWNDDHNLSKNETKDCCKMINFPVASWSCNQSNDHQVKDEFHKTLPKCDGDDNSIISEWKYLYRLVTKVTV